MATRQVDCETWFHDVMVRHRVILRRGEGNGGEPEDPAAILSRVPDIWVDYPEGGSTGRRRTLTLREGGTFVTFKPHLRTPPAGRAVPRSMTRCGRDRRGRKVPVCTVESRSRTIRILVDFASAPILDAASGIDPLEFLANHLLAAPVEALLEEDGEPRVGSEVRSRLSRLLGRPTGEQEALREELSFLQRLGGRLEGFSDPLSRRMQVIAKRLAETGHRPGTEPGPDVRAERELSMLRRLVEKRACRELRFGEGRITGVVNPAPGGPLRGRGPVAFLLSLAPQFSPPLLRVWSWPPEAGQARHPRCLGEGERILVQLLESKQLYRIVDLILNYIDTNRIGIPRRPRRTPAPSAGQRAFRTGWGAPCQVANFSANRIS